jgi:dTDP-4-dehydrorhamnose reductase
MNALLLGATGLLGRALAERLPAALPTCAARPRAGDVPPHDRLRWLRARLDADDDRSLDEALDEAQADVIVNAVGITGAAVQDQARLDAVNARFPHRLAARATARGTRVIHISTDGVFSGARGGYDETDDPDPADAYRRSKLAGEIGAPHLTIRTSFFGRTVRRTGVIEWLIAQRGRVDGFTDYRFTGMAVSILADLIASAVVARPPLEGVYHVGGEAMSKYDLLRAVADRLQLDVQVTPVRRGPAIDRTLNAGRFFVATGCARPTLGDSLAALVGA